VTIRQPSRHCTHVLLQTLLRISPTRRADVRLSAVLLGRSQRPIAVPTAIGRCTAVLFEGRLGDAEKRSHLAPLDLHRSRLRRRCWAPLPLGRAKGGHFLVWLIHPALQRGLLPRQSGPQMLLRLTLTHALFGRQVVQAGMVDLLHVLL